ncbi:hypothetical protein OG738_29805 [Amycolatopsis sp. NBC_01488]|uniref:hypothetical protein n=1 Tax=Amycolatopsis sp. NBC_01488 TaxID=2903563 RepID=UPI002E2B9A98|nr:hypothetical protein [Amycolatopsis sp. NBC_01488]
MAVVGLVGPVCVLATIGALTLPGNVLIGWVLLGAGAGLLVAVGAPRFRPGRVTASGPDLRLGAATASAFVTACLVIAGLLTTVGGGLTAIVLVLLVVGGVWAGYHRRPAPSVSPEPHSVSAPRPAARVLVADMATEELCVAWRRSYFLLLLAADGPARRLVVERRQDFLDEIERRDRRGFLRWLDSGAQAGSDPGPYLTTRN